MGFGHREKIGFNRRMGGGEVVFLRGITSFAFFLKIHTYSR
jgi:hypothetical protein